MGIINQIPEGFLDLIKATTGGRNPTVLSDQVVPTVDMTPFYFPRSLSQRFYVGAFSAVGSDAFIEVPNGEIWNLLALDVSYVPVIAGQVIGYQVEIGQLPNAASPLNSVAIFDNDDISVAPGVPGSSVRSKTFPGGLLLPPGVTIRTTVTQSNIASLNVVTNLLINALMG